MPVPGLSTEKMVSIRRSRPSDPADREEMRREVDDALVFPETVDRLRHGGPLGAVESLST
jgi:hypothetical protein